MGVNTAYAGFAPERWSVAALALAMMGVAAATWVILGSDGDPSQIRWPLVVFPVAVCLAPVLLRTRAVRIVATTTLAGWCVLTGFSIGFLLLPALVAQLAALVREER